MKRETIVYVLLFTGLAMAYFMTRAYLMATHPEWFPTTRAVQTASATQPATTQPDTNPTTVTSATGAGATISPAVEAVATTQSAHDFVVQTVPPEMLLNTTVGSDVRSDAQFPILVGFDSVGGAISKIVVNDFNHALDLKNPKVFKPYTFEAAYPGFEKETRVLATRSVTIDGKTIDLTNALWSGDRVGNVATYTLDLKTPAGRTLQLAKRFEVFERKNTEQGGGYEIAVSMSATELNPVDANAPKLKVKLLFNGPNLPPREMDRNPDQHVVSAYDKSEGKVELTYPLIEEFKKEEPTHELVTKDRPLLWAGISGVYFNAILKPESRDGRGLAADYIASVKSIWLNPGDHVDAPKRVVGTTFETTTFDVGPGQAFSMPMRFYAGPRWRKLLDQPYYSLYPKSFNKTLNLTNGPCASCAPDIIIDGLMKMLRFFHFILRDWGLAIIALVMLVRTILHPITKKSQINMAKMGKLGPEMERLKKKFGEDAQGLQKAQMELYKEQGFTPILGCLPMFLQMPIWISLYTGLQSTFELRQEPFFYGLTWIRDLAKPDHLLTWQPIPLVFGMEISALNILPIILAVVFYLNTKYTPKPPAQTPEQESQQKMMTWMSTLLFPLFLYNGPSGLNLYILTSTAVGIIESKIVRKHIKEQEEAEKGTRVLVDAKPTRASRVKDDDVKKPQPKTGGLMGWLQELQRKAEEMQKHQNNQKKK